MKFSLEAPKNGSEVVKIGPELREITPEVDKRGAEALKTVEDRLKQGVVLSGYGPTGDLIREEPCDLSVYRQRKKHHSKRKDAGQT